MADCEKCGKCVKSLQVSNKYEHIKFKTNKCGKK